VSWDPEGPPGALPRGSRNSRVAASTNTLPLIVSSPRRYRQYAGLALVLLAYLGGILGWAWAVQTVETDRTVPADTTAIEAPVPEPLGPGADGAARLVATDSP